jgi:uncharacterized membrane protein YGL010W
MRRIDQLLLEYGESHKNETNKSIHWICVPLIFFSIVVYANWATVVLVLVTIYYVTLSIPLSIGMMLFGVLCLAVTNLIVRLNIAPLWAVCIGIFVLAWVGQFYGHKVEGKKPSFFKDVQFLLIGPAWLMHFVYKKLGIPY